MGNVPQSKKENQIAFATPWTHDGLSPGGQPKPLTDLGNSERLVLAFGETLHHVQTQKRWLVWDGTRWKPDDTGEVKRLAKLAVRNMLLEAAVMGDDKLRAAVLAHEIRSESDRAIRAMMSLAESHEKIAARVSDFDADAMLFNLSNGTLDLRTGEVREHNRDDLLTKISPVVFDADATAPLWERFLRDVMADDAERIYFLQRAVGYSLTGNITEHVFFLLYGTGANGKSTFLETLQFVFGDYGMQSDFQTFLVSKGNAIRNDIARLDKARFVSAIESEARVRLIPFTVTIPLEQRDHDLAGKLKAESAGILNWCVAGLRDWQAHGLQEPAVITSATSEYRQHEDVIAHFIDAKIIVDLDAETRAGELYRGYKEWAESTGEFCINERDFIDALEDRGFKRHRLKAGWYWKAVKLDGSLGLV